MNEKTIGSVGIIGCGWLGTPLAKQLIAQDVAVMVTSSQANNVEKLSKLGLCAQQLVLPDNENKLISHPVFSHDSLIIAITPQFKQGRVDYADKIVQLIEAAKCIGKVKKVVLLSSSAIYNGLEGKVTEETPLDFSAEKVDILFKAEQAVLGYSEASCVLRLSGLVGPNRHPGRFLARKQQRQQGQPLTDGNCTVNLIHQQDAIGMIIQLLKDKSSGGIFNGVSDTHVSKSQYYQAAAQAISIEPPQFVESSKPNLSRIVCGDKVKCVFNYQFVYPNLLTWL